MNVTYQNGWASSGRLDVDDLIEWLRSEAEISDRPGQLDRLNAIADELAAAQAEIARLQDALLEIKALVDTGGWYSATAGSVAEKALAGEGGDA